MINSGKYNGMDNKDAIEAIRDDLKAVGLGAPPAGGPPVGGPPQQ